MTPTSIISDELPVFPIWLVSFLLPRPPSPKNPIPPFHITSPASLPPSPPPPHSTEKNHTAKKRKCQSRTPAPITPTRPKSSRIRGRTYSPACMNYWVIPRMVLDMRNGWRCTRKSKEIEDTKEIQEGDQI